ncbi:hypothetical protein ZYGR_0H04760 [Zygosaccharomyces rouxii]|uniref:ZYRO0B14960p n=2 Tax=Zygosaccharomyces rouxii TaxID=4956 RepID=C5DS95_ZYGRC|nr:uncharacterized protein ZYRO0B14960g [Zygosaccharomyces rouxii]KAH9199815.1 galactose-binding domain-like protein [Zygosaccharomyces rouxii]GAV47630.1 hypothetical protein ZYGR_0H04760 [Zygosaccharomyces rouxii]CAR26656.1 ZYRO0B14960p [Zygosaccharomyces rouxii]
MSIDSKTFYQRVVSDWLCVDVVGAKLGGKVLSCSDEWFAAAENLISPGEPIRDKTRFTYAGAWYDGWETRRHNEEPYDWVIMRLGPVAARIAGCEVDTAFFDGNHAPAISVDAIYSDSDDLDENDKKWQEVIGKNECGPSTKQFFINDKLTSDRFTHVKLKMYPDGGIARLRLFGRVEPPLKLESTTDLASSLNGGVAIDRSDQHFGSADNLLLPGRGKDMSDGWETKRSRVKGHTDWVVVQLGKQSRRIDKIVVDTAHFRGNFPQFVKVEGTGPSGSLELVPLTKTGPDKEHKFDIGKDYQIDTVKLTLVPDGGVKRLRVFGL